MITPDSRQGACHHVPLRLKNRIRPVESKLLEPEPKSEPGPCSSPLTLRLAQASKHGPEMHLHGIWHCMMSAIVGTRGADPTVLSRTAWSSLGRDVMLRSCHDSCSQVRLCQTHRGTGALSTNLNRFTPHGIYGGVGNLDDIFSFCETRKLPLFKYLARGLFDLATNLGLFVVRLSLSCDLERAAQGVAKASRPFLFSSDAAICARGRLRAECEFSVLIQLVLVL